MSLDQAIRVNEAVIRRAKADGIRARSYLSVVAACPYEGVVPPETVFDLAARMFDAGADELALGDSTGAGSPPQMAHLFETLAHRYGAERLAGHFHDTRAMGLTLTWVAIECGIRKFDSSIGGLGGCPFAPGATGNLATEDLVFMPDRGRLRDRHRHRRPAPRRTDRRGADRPDPRRPHHALPRGQGDAQAGELTAANRGAGKLVCAEEPVAGIA